MKNVIQNILFDLDGTLVDSFADIAECLERSYFEALRMKDVKISREVIGPPLANIIRKVTPDLSEDQVNDLLKVFRHYYDTSNMDGTVPYKGVMETLEELKLKNYLLFLVTYKPFVPTMKIVNLSLIHI